MCRLVSFNDLEFPFPVVGPTASPLSGATALHSEEAMCPLPKRPTRGKHTLPPISAKWPPIFFDRWVLTFHAQLNAKGTVQKFGVCQRNGPHLSWSDECEDTREQPQAGLRDGEGGSQLRLDV